MTSMPAVFFGHGNPMNAIEENNYTRGWASIGARLPRPKAILAISAHWYLPSTLITAMDRPRTMHDFGGFPPELYEVSYPAPGNPALVRRVQELLSPLVAAGPDQRWGLDHGTWSVLIHVYPKADIPVVIPMPEGIYHGTAKIELATWKRPLWFAKTQISTSIDCPKGIPFAGKGENSWDCGDDGLFGWGAEGDVVEHAIAHGVEIVLTNRRRYGMPSDHAIQDALAG